MAWTSKTIARVMKIPSPTTKVGRSFKRKK